MQGLTQVKEMLISAVMSIMSLYKLPHGQYGYSGHVVNLSQDVASFAQSLPQLPSNLDVKKGGANNTHHDFEVRWSFRQSFVVAGYPQTVKLPFLIFFHLILQQDNLITFQEAKNLFELYNK